MGGGGDSSNVMHIFTADAQIKRLFHFLFINLLLKITILLKEKYALFTANCQYIFPPLKNNKNTGGRSPPQTDI
jgi:hypothetical protein